VNARQESLKWLEEVEEQLGQGFQRLGEMLRQHRGSRAAWFASASRQPGDRDPVEALQALRRMHDEALITDTEYEAKKAEILARL
jgi:hypothetical protein